MTYEEKQQAKRDRYAARAARKQREAASREAVARQTLAAIPPGQPILVGHHSERRHRRDLDRADRNMQRAMKAHGSAARLAHKAQTYGTHGISSDDPNAVAKLRERMEELEANRTTIKEYNKRARREGRETTPRYMLANLGNNIRRVRKRIEALEAAAKREEVAIEGDGFRIEEDAGDNRTRIFFDGKPAAEIRQWLKARGWRWARSVGAWQRHLSPQALYQAKDVARKFFGWEEVPS